MYRILALFVYTAALFAQYRGPLHVASPEHLTGAPGSFIWLEGRANGQQGVTVKAPTSLVANITLTWPTAQPAAGSLIEVDGAGQMSGTTDIWRLSVPQTFTASKTGQNTQLFFTSTGGDSRITLSGSGSAGSVTVLEGASVAAARMSGVGIEVYGDDNILSLNRSNGQVSHKFYSVVAGPLNIPVLDLYGGTSGTTTMVNFQATDTIGQFRVAMNGAGASGVTATGGDMLLHTVGFYDAAGAAIIGVGLTGAGRGGGGLIALPASWDGTAVGDCWKIVSLYQTGFGSCGTTGDFVTRTTAQTIATGFPITEDKDFADAVLRVNNTSGLSGTTTLNGSQLFLDTTAGSARVVLDSNAFGIGGTGGRISALNGSINLASMGPDGVIAYDPFSGAIRFRANNASANIGTFSGTSFAGPGVQLSSGGTITSFASSSVARATMGPVGGGGGFSAMDGSTGIMWAGITQLCVGLDNLRIVGGLVVQCFP